MKGIGINCPKCKKLLFKNSYLRPGSFFTTKCFYCGINFELDSQPGKINLTSLELSTDVDNLTDDEEDDIVSLSL